MNYLYKGSYYLSMSPRYYYMSQAFYTMVGINLSGYFTHASTSTDLSVVPVINLTADTVLNFVGDGTMSNPFHI